MMTNISSSLPIELTDLDLTVPVEQPAAQQPGPASNVVALPKAKMTQSIHAFDYSGVSKAVAKEAEATALRIRDRLRTHTLETGRELLIIKQKLGHGNFGKWLDFHFGWKERTAQNYMNSATAFGSAPRVIEVLPPSTVYKLAAKSTPEELRQSVIEEICRGGTPDGREVEKRIAETKSNARQKTNSETIQGGEIDSGESQFQPNLATAESSDLPSTGAALARDGVVTATEPPASNNPSVDHTADPQFDARVQELLAKRITEHLKKRFGPHFEKLRNAMLEIDFIALKKALREA
ncbi:DUF3102 domain-containing protein [Rhizobium ruizarguesonis]|uniref:DUF3102 domain-containing protein n=2 Tax=Rhizobium ruizarguesonis TaxID=2081791 RepID=UPI0013DA4904|nr:DUF3102 domain-containing protein [Rhizobium ruizarguesonis]